jgi:5-methyltetrahydrofolate--homocysteine methyltransferase
VLPFQLVTIGQPIADFANKLFAADSYRNYLEVQLGVQLTEAKYFNAFLPSRVV